MTRCTCCRASGAHRVTVGLVRAMPLCAACEADYGLEADDAGGGWLYLLHLVGHFGAVALGVCAVIAAVTGWQP